MEILKIKDLNFKYNSSENHTLKNINMTINEGELVLICGPSGCGKTTLLKHMKNLLKEQGEYTGSILFKGTDLKNLPSKELVSKLGYVFQNPDNQIVCDTPMTELAFGLENLGVRPEEIRRRIAEMASYFGIVRNLHEDVNTLSGGQKQTLNLASVMAMQPEVLLLDEPTSMLDPVACSEFFSIVNKLNKELGLTVVIVEHNLETLYSMADKVCYMENGELIMQSDNISVAKYLISGNKKMLQALPTPVLMQYKLNKSKMHEHVNEAGNDDFSVALTLPEAKTDDFSVALTLPEAKTDDFSIPLTVKEARRVFQTYVNSISDCQPAKYQISSVSDQAIISAKGLYFRYSKNDPDILKDVYLNVSHGEFLSIHGDNGSGKTTLLKVLAGIHKAYAGKLKAPKCTYLPQNQLLAFTMDDVQKDILYVADANNIDHFAIGELIEKYEFFNKVPDFYGRNPLDLSCGEQQRLALFKMMLTSPEVILLDEPTKALDSFSKEALAKLLLELKSKGTTIIMVSHDLDFSAKYADSCAMFFDGSIISKTDPASFFTSNHFYTTTTARICRGIADNVINLDQLGK